MNLLIKFQCKHCSAAHDTAEAAQGCSCKTTPRVVRMLCCPVCRRPVVEYNDDVQGKAFDQAINKANAHCRLGDPKTTLRCFDCGVEMTTTALQDARTFGSLPRCPICIAVLVNRTGPAVTNPERAIARW